MMVGVHATVKREQGLLSAVRHRSGRLLSAAMLSVFMLATVAAAPAAADPIGAVTINGMPARQCGRDTSDPAVKYCVGSAPLIAIFPPSQIVGSGEVPYARQMAVFNDEPDGNDAITGVDATINPDHQARFAGASSLGPIGGRTDCNPASGHSITCPTLEILRVSGFSATVDYKIVDSAGNGMENNHGGLQSVNVEFNYGNAISPCAGPAAPGGGFASDTARAAGDACTPPSHTQITEAKINANTAFFRFTARHATGFECQLLRNNRMLFRRSCRSPKPYANRLPRGHYVFVVTGVNRAGVDRRSAMKKFTVN
jgi:hypothetical protein